MMDVVYILGKGSKWANNELRFSLRSLEKYFDYRDIYVIGEKPDWLQNVVHIPAEDRYINKVQNAGVKYLMAANDERISEDFVLMNDDFFFLKPVKKIPYYSRGTAKNALKEHKSKGGYYYEAIKQTKRKLERDGLGGEVIDFEVHAPIIFNKTKLKRVIEKGRDGTVCLFRTVYGNLVGVEPKVIKDFKAANVQEFQEEAGRRREFMSISDTMVSSDDFRGWLIDRFPTVSKFENDEGEGIKAAPGISHEYRSYHAAQPFVYSGKQWRRGELLDMNTVKSLKKNPNMKHLWTLK